MRSAQDFFLLRFLKAVLRIFKEFGNDHCMIRASNLTFVSLLAIVPLCAIILSLFSTFGVSQRLLLNILEFLFKDSFPTMHSEIIGNLDRLIGKARSIGLVGILSLIVPSILIINNINTNFNAVWGSRSKRTVLETVLTYASVILTGTVLILAGFTLTYIVRSTSVIIDRSSFSFFSILIIHILPRFFSFLTFFVVIMLIPSGRVKFYSGLIGGLTGAVIWELAKKLFVFGTTRLMKMSAVYGSLAAIPVLLIWLYTAWGIVLFSVEAAFVYQHKGKKWIGKSHERLMPAGQVYLGLEVFIYIAKASMQNAAPPSRRNLSETIGLSENELDFIIGFLKGAGLIAESGKMYPRYSPAADLEEIIVADVVKTVMGSVHSLKKTTLDPLAGKTMSDFLLNGGSSLDYSVKELLLSAPSSRSSSAG